jgi:single-stranded DNA-binding protein
MLKAVIIGNIGSAKFASFNDTKVLTATVASNEKRGEKTYTNWVTLKFWGERAVKLKGIVKKGRKVYAEGRPEAEAYARKNGTPAASQVIHVEGEFLFLDPIPPTAGETSPAEAAAASAPKKSGK